MKAKFTFLFATLMLVVALKTNAQTKISNSNYLLNDKAIANFINGIKSDNPGLRKSAIRYSAEFGVKEAVEPIISVLTNQNENSSIKVLAALSLYDIGDPKGINAVLKAAVTDDDEYVRKMCAAIYYEQTKNNFTKTN